MTMFLLFGLVTAATGIAYFEFRVDIGSEEAFDFFELKRQIEPHENGAFALAGLEAPKSHEDFILWAKEKYKRNRNKTYRRYSSEQMEIAAQRLIDSHNGKELAPPPLREVEDFRWPEEPKHFVCWFPGHVADARFDESCISDKELEQLIVQNLFFLDRYREAISYRNVDFYSGPSAPNLAITINKLFVIEMWSRRKSLNFDDLVLISRNLAYWKKITDQNLLSTIELAGSLINYRLALSLFHELTALYPELLDTYIELEGEFQAALINQDLYDRIARAEYQIIARELCINAEFEFEQAHCKDLSPRLMKPKRSVALMYQRRPIFDKCSNPIEDDSESEFEEEYLWKILTWIRPGNLQGRAYVYNIYGNFFNFCSILDSYKKINDAIGLFKLGADLISLNYSKYELSTYLSSKPELLKVKDSHALYEWDELHGAIKYIENSEYGSRTYEIVVIRQ